MGGQGSRTRGRVEDGDKTLDPDSPGDTVEYDPRHENLDLVVWDGPHRVVHHLVYQ